MRRDSAGGQTEALKEIESAGIARPARRRRRPSAARAAAPNRLQKDSLGARKTAAAAFKAAARQRGVAVFEMLFILLFFVTLFAFTLGFWGAAHTAALQSIAARHYAFEVLNNRAHYEYHRGWSLAGHSEGGEMIEGDEMNEKSQYLGPLKARFFYVTGRRDSEDTIPAKRGLNFFKELGNSPGQSPGGADNPVIKIKTGYGIML